VFCHEREQLRMHGAECGAQKAMTRTILRKYPTAHPLRSGAGLTVAASGITREADDDSGIGLARHGPRSEALAAPPPDRWSIPGISSVRFR